MLFWNPDLSDEYGQKRCPVFQNVLLVLHSFQVSLLLLDMQFWVVQRIDGNLLIPLPLCRKKNAKKFSGQRSHIDEKPLFFK